jgi:hypothetical protein
MGGVYRRIGDATQPAGRPEQRRRLAAGQRQPRAAVPMLQKVVKITNIRTLID